jgi:hypothetical protein
MFQEANVPDPPVKVTLIVTCVAVTAVMSPSMKLTPEFEALSLIPTIHPKLLVDV